MEIPQPVHHLSLIIASIGFMAVPAWSSLRSCGSPSGTKPSELFGVPQFISIYASKQETYFVCAHGFKL